MNDRTASAVGRLRDIMATLRSPGGCPWDAVQTPDTLKRYLVEETYEVLEALDEGKPQAIRDELGDLLLQIVFQARMFEEKGEFDLADVAEAIADKLTRRHPHVFAGEVAETKEAVAAQWDRIKTQEQGGRPGNHPAGSEGSRAMPALLRARKLAEKAVRTGHLRGDATVLVEEVRMQVGRFVAPGKGESAPADDELLGRLLFSLVMIGTLHDLDPEEALRRELDRFARLRWDGNR
jgi:MazG family protein